MSHLVCTPSPIFKSIIKSKGTYIESLKRNKEINSQIFDKVNESFTRGRRLRSSHWLQKEDAISIDSDTKSGKNRRGSKRKRGMIGGLKRQNSLKKVPLALSKQ